MRNGLKLVPALGVAAAALALGACSHGATKGALIGGTAGAVAGVGTTTGAVVGGTAGAVIGDD